MSLDTRIQALLEQADAAYRDGDDREHLMSIIRMLVEIIAAHERRLNRIEDEQWWKSGP